jgi:hypothetical protein
MAYGVFVGQVRRVQGTSPGVPQARVSRTATHEHRKSNRTTTARQPWIGLPRAGDWSIAKLAIVGFVVAGAAVIAYVGVDHVHTASPSAETSSRIDEADKRLANSATESAEPQPLSMETITLAPQAQPSRPIQRKPRPEPIPDWKIEIMK